MNTNIPSSAPEVAPSKSKFLEIATGQAGLSGLATLALLVAAILNPDLWPQFAIVLILSVLTYLFLARANRFTDQLVSGSAENQQSRVEVLANQGAKVWPLVALVIATASVVLSSGTEFNLSAALPVFSASLLLTNSRALALTVPIALTRTLKAATDLGITIQNRLAFENAAKLNLVLFNKGGVLTGTKSELVAVKLASNSTLKDENKLLAFAASVESLSKHVFALAIGKSAVKSNLRVTKPKDFIEVPGYGVQGLVGGKKIFVGSMALLIQRNIRMEVQELIYADESMKSGHSVVCVVIDGVLEGLLTFTDSFKATSAQAVYEVAKERIRVGIITGDSAGTAQNLAEKLSISEVYAELSPERKAAFVYAKQSEGYKVGVITEWASDLALQSSADLSIALIGDQDDVASEADVLVSGEDPAQAAKVIALSALLRRKTNLGLGFSLSYGVLSLLSFVAIVSPLQIPAPPAVAALIGSLSLLFVSLNAYSAGKLK